MLCRARPDRVQLGLEQDSGITRAGLWHLRIPLALRWQGHNRATAVSEPLDATQQQQRIGGLVMVAAGPV